MPQPLPQPPQPGRWRLVRPRQRHVDLRRRRRVEAIRYTERLADAGIQGSVGSVGDSYDNALAESLNGAYTAELIYRKGPWRSVEAVELATLSWVDWFNNRRLLGSATFLQQNLKACTMHIILPR